MSTIKSVIGGSFRAENAFEKAKKEPKLPTRFKNKWVKALRSGKYKQGTGYLKIGTERPEFCCLGVAADIEGCKIPKSAVFLVSNGNFGTLPKQIRGKTGLAYVLATLNDDKISFKRIATFIEKNF